MFELENKNRKAIKSLVKASDVIDDGLLFTSIGHLLTKIGEYTDALHFHNKALELAPKKAPIFSNRALTLIKLNRFSKS